MEEPNKESEESNAVLDFDPMQVYDLGEISLPSYTRPVWLSEGVGTMQ